MDPAQIASGFLSGQWSVISNQLKARPRRYENQVLMVEYNSRTAHDWVDRLKSKAVVIVPKVEVTLDQLAKALGELSPGELETLEILLNPGLRVELKDRWTKAKGELKKGKTLSKGELVAG